VADSQASPSPGWWKAAGGGASSPRCEITRPRAVFSGDAIQHPVSMGLDAAQLAAKLSGFVELDAHVSTRSA
jgi:hypothetical protein